MLRYFVLLLAFTVCLYAQGSGLDIDKLMPQGKKFFMDMTKQAMGVPSFKPENLAAQAFFRNFLDKYTKLDENVKRDMMQHVPKVTKVLDAAAKKFNINPMQAFQMLSTFFESFKQGSTQGLAKQGMKMMGNLLKNKNQQQVAAGGY
ncbi:hypothetical protein WR25_26114 [Diploscapter pachys]|uniref:SXP/RAL-2 family protein Ani s 5-like cation-binding domain-containing protein n=1 Tax=Diploscapter pachys TaxID=2018661 RepID=A0A2A2J5J1_9BILA|nr:hypothetical protein WR25_26114 [Diploscapter pachys]